MFQMEPRLHLLLVAKPKNMCNPGGTRFENMKESWRAVEVWHDVIGLTSFRRDNCEGITSVAAEGPELKESQRKVET